MLQLKDCTIERMTDAPPAGFDCGDNDLNEFLLEDALPHQKALLAVTYLVKHGDDIAAYFSVLNDKIAVEQFPSKSQFRKLQKLIPHRKRGYKSYPAVKLGRLAVSAVLKKQGLGTQLMDFIKVLFIDGNKTGCRFITADAYQDAVSFYEQNGFVPLSEKPEDHQTQLMYFDLKPFAEQLAQLSSEQLTTSAE
jgi:predicted GNAT family N-acyltransferase